MLKKIIEIRNDLNTGLDSDDSIAIGFAINKLDTFIFNHKKALNIDSVSQQRELLEWLSNEDYFNIPKDEINEILEDWETYSSNRG